MICEVCSRLASFKKDNKDYCRDHKPVGSEKTYLICSNENCEKYSMFTKDNVSTCAEHTPGVVMPFIERNKRIHFNPTVEGYVRLAEVRDVECVKFSRNGKNNTNCNLPELGDEPNYFNKCRQHRSNSLYKSKILCSFNDCYKRTANSSNFCGDHNKTPCITVALKRKQPDATPESTNEEESKKQKIQTPPEPATITVGKIKSIDICSDSTIITNGNDKKITLVNDGSFRIVSNE